jgi:glutamate dehydrogenase
VIGAAAVSTAWRSCRTTRPFLVDSVMGEIADQGLSVRAMFHPWSRRSATAPACAADGAPRRESMIQVLLDDVGADREKALVEG